MNARPLPSSLEAPESEPGAGRSAPAGAAYRGSAKSVEPDYRAVFESLPGLYLILTPKLFIADASDAYLGATMTRRGEILGRHIFEAFPKNPSDPDGTGIANLGRSLGSVLETGVADTMAVQQYDIRRPDGAFEERHWSAVNTAVRGGDGQVAFIVHRVEDVTEFVLQKNRSDRGTPAPGAEKMASEIFLRAQQIQDANRRLQSANEELEAFSYSISHDLRAPLRHIAGFADMLRDHLGDGTDSTGRHYLETIFRSAERMGRLIDELLAFSRLGRASMELVPVNLDQLVAEVRLTLLAECRGRSVTWNIVPLPEVRGDLTMMRQVFANLLGNAVKYSRRQPEAVIEIGTFRNQATDVVIFVRDNGAGFDMRHAGKLFGVFQRLHRESEFEGTGVGLAHVRRIVNRHGGRVWAEAYPDRGATFYLSLPSPAVLRPAPRLPAAYYSAEGETR